MATNTPNTPIPESQYSRQLLTFGVEAQRKLTTSCVLIIGLDGIGVEIAKNIVLAGVARVTLNDPTVATLQHLGNQYYAEVGCSLAESSAKHLSELNPYSKVEVNNIPIQNINCCEYDVVVVNGQSLSRQRLIGDRCHAQGVKFIATNDCGAFASIFADFGEHIIVDQTGNDCVTTEVLIEYIDCQYICTTSEPCEYDDGTTVRIGEKLFTIDTRGNNKFVLCGVTDGMTFPANARVTEVKIPFGIQHNSFTQEITSPTIVPVDSTDVYSVHNGLIAMASFEDTFAKPVSPDDAHSVVEMAKAYYPDINVSIVEKMAKSKGSIIGVCNWLGGIGAQQVIIAITGKYMPLTQWLFVDCSQIIPDNVIVTQVNDRYQLLRNVIGDAALTTLQTSPVFMIGAGAIGCEMLKNLALMGVRNITITDDDHIEPSNLNRQFLFRQNHIGQQKSTTAAAVINTMNPDIHIQADCNRVGKETENIYTDEFFAGIGMVVNALDNVQARLYVDSRCVKNHKPLFESGTNGVRGHTQVILPGLTTSYGSKPQPEVKSIPFCTLKSFPQNPTHCIEHAKASFFMGVFVDLMNDVNNIIGNSTDSTKTREFTRAKKFIAAINDGEFDDLIKFARALFYKYFTKRILTINYNYPANYEQDGKPFWVGSKRQPTPLEFDNTPLNIAFIKSTAMILAKCLQVEPTDYTDNQYFDIANQWKQPEFIPKKRDLTTEETLHEKTSVDMSMPAHIPQCIPAEFEKDDDTNHHIDAIAASANLRAMCYMIDQTPRLMIKKIAGNIQPAVATTTSAVSGLISIEMIKYAEKLPLSAYAGYYLNLGASSYVAYRPEVCPRVQLSETLSYTLWDKWTVNKAKTIAELLREFKTHKLTIGMITQGNTTVFTLTDMDLIDESIGELCEVDNIPIKIMFTDKKVTPMIYIV